MPKFKSRFGQESEVYGLPGYPDYTSEEDVEGGVVDQYSSGKTSEHWGGVRNTNSG